MNERIEELLKQLTEEVFKVWNTATDANIRIEPDGYMSICVEKFEKNDDLPIEAWKRKELFDSWKPVDDDGWAKDMSDEQNAYYKAHKLLLEEE